MDLSLRHSIRIAAARLATAYLIVLVVAISTSLYLNAIHHKRLAESLILAARNDLVIRDLRSAIGVLIPSVGEGFEAISFSTADGSLIFALPSQIEFRNKSSSLFISTFEGRISSGETGSTIGQLSFTYSWATAAALPLMMWLAFLGLALPIFRMLKASIERRHREVLQLQESEILALIAKQVSHDIRSPLSAISLAAQGLSSVENEPKIRLIQDAAKRISEIASDLVKSKPSQLPLSGVQSHTHLNVHCETVRLADILRQIHSESTVLHSHRTGIKINLDIKDEVGSQASVDRKELLRVLSNLLNNSVEAIEAEGTITLSLRVYKNEIGIILSDTGKGIPEEILPRLGNEVISWGKDGTASGSGLGVRHAKLAIEGMGGRLMIQSRLGAGTIVTITFPKI